MQSFHWFIFIINVDSCIDLKLNLPSMAFSYFVILNIIKHLREKVYTRCKETTIVNECFLQAWNLVHYLTKFTLNKLKIIRLKSNTLNSPVNSLGRDDWRTSSVTLLGLAEMCGDTSKVKGQLSVGTFLRGYNLIIFFDTFFLEMVKACT